MPMKKILFVCCWAWCSAAACAQTASTDSTVFRAYLFNIEYSIYMRINFYKQDIVIPGQELLGTLPGYLGKERNSFCWPVLQADIKGKEARLLMVNDYGSEDLEAVLTCVDDSTYTLKQGKGSTLKVPNNGKWQKLPRVLTLKRK